MSSQLRVRRFTCLLMALMVTAPHFSVRADEEKSKKKGLQFNVGTSANSLPSELKSLKDEDEDEDNGEPVIKLPALPPRKSPSGTIQKAAISARTSANSMSGIANSAFPGMTCALIDNRPHKALLDAVQALARVVVVTPNCQNNADMVKMSEEAKKLMSAGTSLQGLWNSPELLAQDQKNLVDFHNNLGTMISGINRVAETLQQNTLVNSRCGKELMTGGGVLVAVSDLISSLAPFALIGASMNPSMGMALPFILGTTGVGSVAKIIKNLHDQNSLDMAKPETREAILQNICEFSKIQQRVRFLKLAQSGQLEQVTKEIQGMKQSTYASLKEQFGDRVFAIADIRTDLAQMLRSAATTLKKDESELKGIQAQLKDQTDPHLNCYVAREVVAKAGADSAFPTRAISNFKKLVENQRNPNLGQSALLGAEEKLRLQLIAKSQDESDGAIQQCASMGKSYVDSLARILQATRETGTKLTASLDKELSRDSEYAVFRRTETAAQSEITNLKKIAGILEKLNMDNAVIDKVEMDAQMKELKAALFGTPAGLPIVRGSSPAMTWLDFIDSQHAQSISDFNIEMKSLINDAYSITRTGKMDIYQKNADGSIKRDRFGHPQRRSGYEQDLILLEDYKTSNQLKNLTNVIAPVGSDNHKAICQRLENIWLSWASAMDQLAAESFFCQNIQGFFDASTESALIRRCIGTRDLSGKVLVASEIQSKQAVLADKGYKTQALMVSAKMKELACEMPNAAILQ